MHLTLPAVTRFDMQPELRGPTLLLRPLRQQDQGSLWQCASDPLVWEQHPDRTRADPEGFARFFAGSLESGGALAVIDLTSGAIIGSSRYYDWEPDLREVAIGYTFLVRQYWGGSANREMKTLMIRHAAQWADAIWFHVAATNLRSRRAMEKLGAKACFMDKRPLNGELLDFVYYRIETAGWR